MEHNTYFGEQHHLANHIYSQREKYPKSKNKNNPAPLPTVFALEAVLIQLFLKNIHKGHLQYATCIFNLVGSINALSIFQ